MVSLNDQLWKVHGTTDPMSNWRTNDSVAGFAFQQANRGGNGKDLDTTLRITRTFEQPSVQLVMYNTTPDEDPDESAAGLYIVLDPTQETQPDGIVCAMKFGVDNEPPRYGLGRVKQGRDIVDVPLGVDVLRSQIRVTTQFPGMGPEETIEPTCRITGGNRTETVTIGSKVLPSGAQVGLWTRNGSATFTGIMVYERIP